ncbi:substrate-binding periplasmic protein [Pseudodesulfovibrio karagichevae]|uniref:Substrate-binding periplasmic protein n=1 Tax=Pseudodesulfovibrio karagichevae TaxID=3239305 RepID=A0ABV4JYU0_9BACT
MSTLARHTPRFRALTGLALCVAAAALWLSSASPVQVREPYRIGYTPDAEIHVESMKRLAVAYERAGLPVEFVPLPQKRSLVQAVDGVIDGDVGRIPGLEKTFPSLVRVDVKLLDLNGAAYVVRERRFGEYRPELLATLRVGAVRGVLWAEKAMHGHRLDLVNNYKTLFEMLLEGRLDLALASRLSAEYFIYGNRARYARIRRLDPLVYSEPFYHYINIKNADIVPKLEKALRELLAEDYWHDGEGN